MPGALPPVRKEHMMRLLKQANYLTAALLTSCAMSGCGALPAKTMAPDFCATAQAIYVSKTDIFTDATAREILKHNTTGRKLCGW